MTGRLRLRDSVIEGKAEAESEAEKEQESIINETQIESEVGKWALKIKPHFWDQ